MIVPAAVAVVLSLAAYLYFHRTAKLTDKDTIVLADFTNTTGDPVFDGTLRQGMAVQLEQMPFLSLISDGASSKLRRLADARLWCGSLLNELQARLPDGSLQALGATLDTQRTAAPEMFWMRSKRRPQEKKTF